MATNYCQSHILSQGRQGLFRTARPILELLKIYGVQIPSVYVTSKLDF